MNKGNLVQFPSPPRGLKAIPWRLPIYLFRVRLGWILGNRFLLLRHKGRISGIDRFAVLEIIHRQPEESSYFVVSGFGTHSDWYQNILQHSAVEIQVGNIRSPAKARQLESSEGGKVLLIYAGKNPGSLKALSKIMGYEIDFTPEGILDFGRQIPVIQFKLTEPLPNKAAPEEE